MATTWAHDRRQIQFVALVGIVAVVVAAGIWLVTSGSGRPITAYFTNTSALYPDNDVRMLGVPIGKIDTITPEGNQVRVDMTISDDDVVLPADVKAAIVSPSLVTGRYVQLTPAYTGGPQWQGEPVPVERTAVPLGVDDLTRTATELSRALGPQGANSTGAVSDALNVGAQNLDGNGRALNDTIRNLGGLGATLNGSSKDLFGTITELQKFVATIKENDPGVRELNGKLADVTSFLASQRGELGTSLRELSFALGEVAGFVQDNRATLKSNVDKLAGVSQEIVDHQKALAEITDVAPAALGNLANIYNGSSETLDTRVNFNELSQPLPNLVCQFAQSQQPKGPDGMPLPIVGDLGTACTNILSGLSILPNPIAPPGTEGGLPAAPGLPLNPLPGTPLSSTGDPAAPLLAPLGANPQTPAPAAGPSATPAPTTSAPASPTREPSGGGLFGGLLGGGS
ncbi:virulence factor Mce-like protein [Pseudonocardia sediminis]|uniref:Virulence factor Mce-like protein n=1 Tax=Pseudonocardia sediminis TaxID=1397368 RepID=A0A4Q7V2S4_PSEST|nr:MCE family protein [Pseudonocardia sediminis]RZT88405.1 virulence factor Mce-like protein [Pseudonocardia sediminis]